MAMVLGIYAIAPACSLFGGTGACVSSVVSFAFGDRVYCYSGWTQAECHDNDLEQVNGASWSLRRGRSCDDLDYLEGSNPWP